MLQRDHNNDLATGGKPPRQLSLGQVESLDAAEERERRWLAQTTESIASPPRERPREQNPFF